MLRFKIIEMKGDNMPKKKTETQEVIEKIFEYTLEDIMGERFGSYSKYIIQERAIPDARDGFKTGSTSYFIFYA